MKRTAVALVAVLLVVSSTGVAVGAASDSTSTTTVVAVGDSPEALLAANAIANANDYSIVRVPSEGFTPHARQVLTDRTEHGDLSQAVVVGSNISSVVSELQSVDISVSDQIEADNSGQLLHDAAVQQWNSADAAFITSNATSDYRKVALALTNDTVGDIPVVSESEYSGVLSYLGASTVYVAPGVSQETRDDLSASYTVKTAPANVSLEQSLQEVAAGYASDSDTVAVAHPQNVLLGAQFGAMDSASVIVSENESSLGTEAKTTLQKQSTNTTTYVVGDSVPSSGVTDAAPGTVWSLQEYPGLRSHLAVVDYPYGVLVSSVDKVSNGKYDVGVTNIGFSEIPSPEGEPISLRWEGDIIGSEPSGTHTDNGYVVTHTASMSSGDSFQVRLEASSVSNGGHPYLNYYVETDSGGLVSSGNAELALPFDSNNPSRVAIVAVVVATAVIGGAVYNVIRQKRPRRRSEAGPRRLGGSVLTMENGMRVVVLGVGLAMMAIPDPLPLVDELAISAGMMLVEFAVIQE